MIHIKNGIKNITRQPIRFFLFVVLVFLVAILGGLGITIWNSADSLMEASDKLYKTRVTIRKESLEEAGSWDAKNVASSKYVMGQNEVVKGLGRIAAIKNDSLEQMQGLAIVSVQVMDISKERLYEESDTALTKVTAVVQSVLYGEIKTQQYVILDVSQEVKEKWNGDFEPGHTYFAFGKCSYAKSNYPVFTVLMPGGDEGEQEDAKLAKLAPIEDITKTGAPSEQELWQQYAKALEDTAEMFPIYAMDNAALWDEFYFGQAEIVDGELFEASDEKVCLIDDRFAAKNGLAVGDVLPVRFFYRESGNIIRELWGEAQETEGEYRIAGIYKYQEELENAIYISRDETVHQKSADGILLQLQIENGREDAFLERFGADQSEEIVTEAEDQGYAQAILPVKAIYRQAVGMTFLGLLLGIAVMVFVSRNYYNGTKQQLDIIRELGGSRSAVRQYFGSGLVLAVTMGAVAGFFVQKALLAPLMSVLLNQNYLKYNANLHYSQLAGAENFDALEHAIGNSDYGFLMVLLLEAVTVLLTFSLCGDTERRRKQAGKTKQKAQKTKRHTKRMPSQKFNAIPSMNVRFAVRELFRNGKQTAVFVLLTFFLTGLTGAVWLVKENQAAEMQRLYEGQKISGYITSQARLSKENAPLYVETAIMPLLTEAADKEAVLQSNQDFLQELNREVYWENLTAEERCGKAADLYREWKQEVLEGQKYIEDFGQSKRLGYEYMGRAKEAEEFPDIPFHTNAYGNDWLLNQIPSMDSAVFCDSYGYTEPGIENKTCYLEGYDDSFLEKSEMICAVSEAFLQENGLALGDKIRLAVYTTVNGPRIAVVDARIVGSYEGKQQDIYLPLGMLYGTYFLPDLEYEYWEEMLGQWQDEQNSMLLLYYGYGLMDSVSAFRFSIADNRELSDFRDTLGKIGYSEKYQVNELRQIVILEDGTFLRALQSINRHIEQMDFILGMLLILTAGISAAASFVLMNQMKPEICLMVELGTQKKRVICIWMLRYGMAALCGMIPAALLYLGISLQQKAALHMGGLLLVTAEILGMMWIAALVSTKRVYREMLQERKAKNGKMV